VPMDVTQKGAFTTQTARCIVTAHSSDGERSLAVALWNCSGYLVNRGSITECLPADDRSNLLDFA
jgi:hypothetical protein